MNTSDHHLISGIHIRRASLQDSPILEDYLRAMLEAMASYGGNPLAETSHLIDTLHSSVEFGLNQIGHIYLVAESGEGGTPALGMAWASLVNPEDVFRKQKILHIHALYVLPAQRQRGIGRLLMEAALDWGRSQGCEKVELNSLAGNPALKLYEELGFVVFELELRRNL